MSVAAACTRRFAPITLVVVALIAAPSAVAASGRVHVTDRKKVDAEDGVTLFSNGDFKVTGRCEDNGGGDFTANTFVAARRNNLLYFGSYDGSFDTDFDSTDPKVDLTGSDASGTTKDFNGEDYNQDFYGEGKGGRVTQGQVATGVHIKGADCTFSGIFDSPAKSGPADLTPRVRVAAGDTAKIFSNRDFRVSGTCVDNGGGDLTAVPLLAAKRNNLLYLASDTNGVDTDFDASDPKVDFSSPAHHATGTAPAFSGYDYYQEFWAEGTGGRVLDGRVADGVHVRGGDCTFSGIFTGLARGGAVHPIPRVKVSAGHGAKLFENGDFKVTGRCVDNGGGDFTAKTFLAARRNNLLVWDSDRSPSLDSSFGTGDPPLEISPDYDASGPDPLFYGYDYYQEFYGEGTGGTVLNGRVATGVHIKGADCTFSGMFIGS